MKTLLNLKFPLKEVRYVAGADIATTSSKNEGVAAAIVFTFPDLIPVEHVWAEGPLQFPYIPGLLSFREIPLLLSAFQKLEIEPDIVFIDGQGVAHP